MSNANNTLENMMEEQQNAVENMMNAIMNNENNAANSNSKNNAANANSNSKNNSANVKKNNANSNSKNSNNKMVEFSIEDPETGKMLKVKIDADKTVADLKQQLEKQHRKKSHKFHLVHNNGEKEEDDMKALELSSKVSEHKNKNLRVVRKDRVFSLTEPLIKFREYKGEKVEQENPYGSFDGTDPYPAARKAARKIIRSKKLEGEDIFNLPEFKFSIVEKTRGSKNKVYHYIGHNNLKKPMKKSFGPRTETIEIEARIRKYNPNSNNKKNNMNK